MVRKDVKVALIVALVAAAAYVAYRLYKSHQASQTTNDTGSPTVGSNLNSTLASLTGGSEAQGTQVQPVLSVPVNVNISESSTMPPEQSANPVIPAGTTTPSTLTAGSTAAGATGASANGNSPTATSTVNPAASSTSAASGSSGTSGTSPGQTSGSGASSSSLPTLKNASAAQIKKAYGPKRSAQDQGKLFINGQWYSVPKTG
jgi:hypothetical protein